MPEAQKNGTSGLSRAAKTVLGVFFALFWAVTAAFALELSVVVKRVMVESLNPYVLGVKAWPDFWAILDMTEEGTLLLAEGLECYLNEKVPPAAVPVVEEHTGITFPRYSETDRQLYAEIQGEIIVLCPPSEIIEAVYAEEGAASVFSMSPPALLGARLREAAGMIQINGADALVGRVLSTGTPESVSGAINGHPVRLSCFPLSPESGGGLLCAWRDVRDPSLTEVVSTQMDSGTDSQWKIPLLEYKKNYRYPTGKLYTNNLGFWDDDVAVPKPAGCFRIVCVGGSTTEEGLAKDLSYPNLLEKQLNGRFGGVPRFEVVNAGVVGIDSRGERRRILDYLAMEPDLIVEYNVVNDICHWIMPQLSERLGPVRRLLGTSRFINQKFNGLLWPDDAAFEKIFDETRMENLRVFVKAARSRGVPVAFASFCAPDPDKLRGEELDFMEWQIRTFWQGKYYGYRTYYRLVQVYNRMLKAYCEREGLIYLAVAENYSGDTRDFSDVCHMRPGGIEKKANAFFSELLAELEKMVGALPAASRPSDAGEALPLDVGAASREEFLRQFPRTGLNTTLEDAMLLRILVETRNAQRGVEVGSFTGYGALHMGIAFERTGGHLYTLEIDPEAVKTCRENIAKTGLEKSVTCVEGDALKTLPALEGTFDFVFIDAVKADYFKYFQLIDPKLKAGAVIVADNVIVSADAMRDYLDYVRNNPDYETVTVRASDEKKDGMAITYKLR